MSSHDLKKTSLWVLLLGALGVVYGDIGTSPLYAVNEIFFGHGHVPLNYESILGAIGLVIWTLTFVVTFKYVAFVLLANHEGQGGVFALLGLLSQFKKRTTIIILLTILVLAAGLLFGEGIITPAISILSAVEGLSIATNIFAPYIVPITLIVMAILFIFQYKGTSKVGAIFGPIMVLWFLSLALLGINQIILHPYILEALNPIHALRLMAVLGVKGVLLMLGSVVLAVTGVEALYADMGHFGLKPIRFSWLLFVYPALILNYLGQGAYLIGGSQVFQNNVFYSLVPSQLLVPMVILATLATMIASQALISGAYSLVAQAVALNYMPRFRIVHTNKNHEGQIYVPAVNWLLFIGSATLVLTFKSSTALASAYGFAVSGVMFTTSLAMFSIAALYWKWGWFRSILLFGIFAIVDFCFLVANSLKFLEGGYVPVTIGLSLFIIMMVWHWGRTRILNAYTNYAEKRQMSDLVALKEKLKAGAGMIADERGQFVEADRVVIFLVQNPINSPEDRVPVIVRSHMRHNGSIPRYTILLNITQEKKAYVRTNRYIVTDFGNNLVSVEAHFGFMEDINIENIIQYMKDKLQLPGLNYDRYLIKVGGEEIHIDHEKTSLIFLLRIKFFRLLQRLASPTYRYFGLKTNTSLSTSAIPMSVSDENWEIRLPALDLIES